MTGAAASAPFTIGVSGHRPNRLAMPHVTLREQCRAILAALAAGVAPRPIVALSALAEGSDRAFAEAALEHGLELHTLLPFRRSDYVTTFGDQATTPGFDRLLGAATVVEELPGSLERSTDAYEAVGVETVRRSAILLAVWDGRPAAGRGGTPHVIEMALAAAKPVLWLDATGGSPLRVLPAAAVAAGDPLAAAIEGAAPLGRDDLNQLARGMGVR